MRRRPDPAGCRSGTCPAPPRLRLEREVRNEAGLQRAHAENEEAAQADSEQDHARLVARPAKSDDRMPQREPWRERKRAHGAHEARARQMQHERDSRRTQSRRWRPPEGMPPARRRRRRARPLTASVAVTCVQSIALHLLAIGPPAGVATVPAAPGSASSPRISRSGLTRRTSRSGTSAKSSETSRPTASPCSTADAVSPYEMSPIDAVSDAGIEDRATAARTTPSRLPVRPRSTTCST